MMLRAGGDDPLYVYVHELLLGRSPDEYDEDEDEDEDEEVLVEWDASAGEVTVFYWDSHDHGCELRIPMGWSRRRAHEALAEAGLI